MSAQPVNAPCAVPGCPGHEAPASWRDFRDPHGLSTEDDWAMWREYLAWQDEAELAHGPPEDCDCCLSPRGRHCQNCHP